MDVVDWPSEALSETEPVFVIGVLGEDPFGKALDRIVANELIRNRKIVIKRYRNVQEISTCHILYISRSETPRLNHILKFLEQKSILTVGEADRFPAPDTIICFFVAQNKLRLKINVGAARAAGLTISSKLLRQAEVADARQVP